MASGQPLMSIGFTAIYQGPDCAQRPISSVFNRCFKAFAGKTYSNDIDHFLIMFVVEGGIRTLKHQGIRNVRLEAARRRIGGEIHLKECDWDRPGQEYIEIAAEYVLEIIVLFVNRIRSKGLSIEVPSLLCDTFAGVKCALECGPDTSKIEPILQRFHEINVVRKLLEGKD